jgi:hypothetical protein
MEPRDIDRLCAERQWKRSRLLLELRRAARGLRQELPGDDSLRRMVREWASGRRRLSRQYAELLSAVFGVPFEVSSGVDSSAAAEELSERLARVESSLDLSTVELFEGQTQSLRLLDRRLGAARLLVQAEAHVTQMSELMAYCLPGPIRRALALAVAEGAALAGWQALDLGQPSKSWSLHEMAKSAARDSGDATVIAHVTAQQAYALLDLNRPGDAVRQIAHAREEFAQRVPALMRAWLWAAEAEASAAAADTSHTLRALDEAEKALPHQWDDDFPFLALDADHLARWRGHCLARVGSDEAVNDLLVAITRHDRTFARAAAGLHTDLAFAYLHQGEMDAAKVNAEEAARLAELTSSMRQKRRISQLLAKASV